MLPKWYVTKVGLISMVTLKEACVKIVLSVVIHGTCDTWQAYSRYTPFTVPKKAPETARNLKQVRVEVDTRFKDQMREKLNW